VCSSDLRLPTVFIFPGKNKREASDPKLDPLPKKIKKILLFLVKFRLGGKQKIFFYFFGEGSGFWVLSFTFIFSRKNKNGP
jgi:hypothetical protein